MKINVIRKDKMLREPGIIPAGQCLVQEDGSVLMVLGTVGTPIKHAAVVFREDKYPMLMIRAEDEYVDAAPRGQLAEILVEPF